MMYSLTLHTAHMENKERFELISDLYYAILNKDPDWHFFYESEFGDFLRITDSIFPLVKDFLKERNIKYDLDRVWKEDLDFVSENQDYFREMFHMNSVFAIKYSGDEKYLVKMLSYWIDRYSHSLHDMLHMRIGGVMEKEGLSLSSAVLQRAWYDGYRQHYLDSKKHNEEKNGKDN